MMAEPAFSVCGRPIVPERIPDGVGVADLVDALGNTCFQARNLGRAARLWAQMIDDGDTIWLAIAGAGIAGGLGGFVIDLIDRGFVDVICSTGAQVYHDLHFAYGLPVHQVAAPVNDELLRRRGETRIYDILVRETETLVAQDKIVRAFMEELLSHGDRELSSPEFNYRLGEYVNRTAPHPDRSFVARASRQEIPIFWDSAANHSIGMNAARCVLGGKSLRLSASEDVLLSAGITYAAGQTSFVILGGGGPKNFIQQTGPTLQQVLEIEYEGAERGLQITAASEQDGGLSGCTFEEAVTWGKYRNCGNDKLVRVWAEYSLVLPLLTAYVCDRCEARDPKRLFPQLPRLREMLAAAALQQESAQ